MFTRRRLGQPSRGGLMIAMLLALALVAAACGDDDTATTTGATTAGTDAATTSSSGAVSPSDLYANCPAGEDHGGFIFIESGDGIHNVPYWGAQYFGIGQDFGLDIANVEFQEGGGASSQIFLGGTGDLWSSGFNSVLNVSGTVPLTVIAVLTNRVFHKVIAAPGSGIDSLEDLKGKKIGVSGFGSFSWTVTNWALANEVGFDLDNDVEFVAIGGGSAIVAAIESGNVDAGVVSPPTYDKAIDAGLAVLVHDYATDDNLGVIPSLSLIARTESVLEDPCKFKAISDTIAEALRLVRADNDWAMEVTLDMMGESVSEEILTDLINTYAGVPGIYTITGEISEEMYENTLKAMSAVDVYDLSNVASYEDLTMYTPPKP